MLNIYRNATMRNYSERVSAFERLRDVTPASGRIPSATYSRYQPETEQPGPDAQIVRFPRLGEVAIREAAIMPAPLSKEELLHREPTIENVLAALAALPDVPPKDIPVDHYNGHGLNR